MKRKKAKEKMKIEDSNTKRKSARSITTVDIIVPDLAKKTRSFSTVGINRTCSNKGGKKDKYGNSMLKLVDRVCASIEPIYYECRQRVELL